MKNLILTSLLVVSGIASSENIIDIYNEALENDPTYRAAEFSLLSGKEFVVQGRAGLMPSVSISGSTNWNESYQDGNLSNEYNSFSSSARLTQPLIRLDSWFQYKRSQALTDAAEADFGYEQQNLVVRTAELYFGVLRTIDNLNASKSEEKAIKKQLDQAKQRYEVGLSAITGVQEAQLAYDLSLAARIRTEGAVFSAREALNALIGREVYSIDPLGDNLPIVNPSPASKQDWVNLAITSNYKLKAAKLRRDASKNSARGAASDHLPKVDIVGSASKSETNQYYIDDFDAPILISVPQETERRAYSIQFSMPIFQGGSVNSRRKQAYANYDKSIEDTLFIERSVIQEVRSEYSNVLSLVASVNAQEQAVVSATSALEATKVGYEVGTRNIVDLLQSEKNLYSAERNLANAKYDYILSNLRLGLAAGNLEPENIADINNFLN